MTPRTRKTITFGIGLAVGFGLYDWFVYREFNVVSVVVGAVAASILYNYILKRREQRQEDRAFVARRDEEIRQEKLKDQEGGEDL